MTKPRLVVPGSTYRITRRTLLSLPRLEPNPVTNQILLYCASLAAQKSGVRIHALVAMNNYQEITVTDSEGKLPIFLRELHRSTAKCLNASQNESENLWAAEHTSVSLLPCVDDVLDQIVRTAIAPVNAGLVDHPSHWRGVLLWRPGTCVTVQRPTAYFDANGSAPASLELQIDTPRAAVNAGVPWRQRVAEAVNRCVRAAVESVSSSVRGLLGSAKGAKTSITDNAARRGGRTICPIAQTKFDTLRKKCEDMYLAFQRAYRSAELLWRKGDRKVEFPVGTWWMRVHHNAKTASGRPALS